MIFLIESVWCIKITSYSGSDIVL